MALVCGASWEEPLLLLEMAPWVDGSSAGPQGHPDTCRAFLGMHPTACKQGHGKPLGLACVVTLHPKLWARMELLFCAPLTESPSGLG